MSKAASTGTKRNQEERGQPSEAARTPTLDQVFNAALGAACQLGLDLYANTNPGEYVAAIKQQVGLTSAQTPPSRRVSLSEDDDEDAGKSFGVLMKEKSLHHSPGPTKHQEAPTSLQFIQASNVFNPEKCWSQLHEMVLYDGDQPRLCNLCYINLSDSKPRQKRLWKWCKECDFDICHSCAWDSGLVSVFAMINTLTENVLVPKARSSRTWYEKSREDLESATLLRPSLRDELNQSFIKLEKTSLDLLDAMKLTEKPVLNVAVLGPMKAGKSTLVNAAVGYEILPSRQMAMTMVPTRIIHRNSLGSMIRFSNPSVTVFNQALRWLKLRLVSETYRLAQLHAAEELDLINRISIGALRTFAEEFSVDARQNLFEMKRHLMDVHLFSRIMHLIFPDCSDDPVVHIMQNAETCLEHCPVLELCMHMFEGTSDVCLVDTPGLREAKFAIDGISMLKQVDVAMVVLNAKSFQDTDGYESLQIAKELNRLQGTACYLIINRKDMIDERDLPNLPRVAASALLGDIDQISNVVAVSAGYALYGKLMADAMKKYPNLDKGKGLTLENDTICDWMYMAGNRALDERTSRIIKKFEKLTASEIFCATQEMLQRSSLLDVRFLLEKAIQAKSNITIRSLAKQVQTLALSIQEAINKLIADAKLENILADVQSQGDLVINTARPAVETATQALMVALSAKVEMIKLVDALLLAESAKTDFASGFYRICVDDPAITSKQGDLYLNLKSESEVTNHLSLWNTSLTSFQSALDQYCTEVECNTQKWLRLLRPNEYTTLSFRFSSVRSFPFDMIIRQDELSIWVVPVFFGPTRQRVKLENVISVYYSKVDSNTTYAKDLMKTEISKVFDPIINSLTSAQEIAAAHLAKEESAFETKRQRLQEFQVAAQSLVDPYFGLECIKENAERVQKYASAGLLGSGELKF